MLEIETPGLVCRRSGLALAEELHMKIPQAFEQFVRTIYPETPGVTDSLESMAAAAIEDSYGNDFRPVACCK